MAETERRSRIRFTPRAFVRIAAVMLILGGLGVFAYVAYQTWFSGLATSAAQNRLEAEFASRRSGEPVSTTTTAPAPGDDPLAFDDPNDVPVIVPPESTELRVFEVEGVVSEEAPGVGQPVGRITIPDIDLDWIVVEGVAPAQLRDGPGHMEGTPVPGQAGNAVISGHRTTNGAPFHDIDLLEPGARIEVETLLGVHTYEVAETLIVAPTDFWVAEHRDGAWLTLTSCHPKLSARQRIVVVARLVEGPNYPAAVVAAAA